MRTRLIVWALAVVIAALAAHSLGVAGDEVPSLSSTYPIPLVVPVFLGFPRLLIATAFGACFALWSKQLFRGSPEIPRRSFILFVVLALCPLYLLSLAGTSACGIREHTTSLGLLVLLLPVP